MTSHAPKATEPAIRKSMRSNRSKDTGPEVRLRSELHGMGLRFFKNRRPLTGQRTEVDVIFPGKRLAVMVDGCFWHSCPEHGSSPLSNASFWNEKLDTNVARDRRNQSALEAEGWSVMRVWEHEVGKDAAARVYERLEELG